MACGHGQVGRTSGHARTEPGPWRCLSSAPARATSITRLSVGGARKYNLCGYVTRPALYAGSQFILGPLAHWPMHACATVQGPFANIGHGLLGACCSNAALTVHVRNVLCCIVLYCIVLHCVVLCCIALYCIALYCIVLYCIVSNCILSYPFFSLFYSFAKVFHSFLFYSVLFSYFLLSYTVFCCILSSPILFYPILFYFGLLYCIVL